MDKRRCASKKLRRRQLDALYSQLQPIVDASGSSASWLRDIREALGISSLQFARLLGISRQAYSKLEASEQKQTIEMASLNRVAAAIGFRVVYAIVPAAKHLSIESLLRERAVKVASKSVGRVAHTMSLENQAIVPKEQELQIRDLADELIATLDKSLWEEA